MDRAPQKAKAKRKQMRLGGEVSASTSASGVIAEPGQNDVLFGRGGDTNYHVGNHRLRILIADHYKQRYQSTTSRKKKAAIGKEVVDRWRSGQDPPGRFLARIEPSKGNSSLWYDVGDDVAVKKAIKVLGEKDRRVHKVQPAAATGQLESPGARSLPNLLSGGSSLTNAQHDDHETPSALGEAQTMIPELEVSLEGTLPILEPAHRRVSGDHIERRPDLEVSSLDLLQGVLPPVPRAATMPLPGNEIHQEAEAIPSAAFLTSVFDEVRGKETDSHSCSEESHDCMSL